MIAWYASSMSQGKIARQTIAHRGKRLEYFTIVWNSLEGLIAVAAGVIAGDGRVIGHNDSLSTTTVVLPDGRENEQAQAFVSKLATG